jgi:hypothetical protein
MKDQLLERLTDWGLSATGKPGNVPTRYACEVALPDHPDTADVRLAVRKAFLDGMTFANSIADAASHLLPA